MDEERPAAARIGHYLFLLTLLGKGLLGLVQIATAIAIMIGIAAHLPDIAAWLVRAELAEDPTDFIASRFVALAAGAPEARTTFYALYFMAHGLLHIAVVVALLRGSGWAYPAAIAVLVAFILYQLAEWLMAGGSMLLILSAIDLLVIYLTWREWVWRHRMTH